MQSHSDNPATAQSLLFAEPATDPDPLWAAWTAADERARRRFFDQIQADFLRAAQKARRQAKASNTRGVA